MYSIQVLGKPKITNERGRSVQEEFVIPFPACRPSSIHAKSITIPRSAKPLGG